MKAKRSKSKPRSGGRSRSRTGSTKNGLRAGKQQAERPAESPRLAPETVEAPLVLIVDDYEDARDMCSELLRYYGFRTETAASGIEALEKAQRLLPAVILMDLSLPGMDGWEATRRLKADERTRAIPVVAVTGHALGGHSENAREAGCDFFLTKPVLPDALIAEVKRIVGSAPSRSVSPPRGALPLGPRGEGSRGDGVSPPGKLNGCSSERKK